jgi:hypothetical protein
VAGEEEAGIGSEAEAEEERAVGGEREVVVLLYEIRQFSWSLRDGNETDLRRHPSRCPEERPFPCPRPPAVGTGLAPAKQEPPPRWHPSTARLIPPTPAPTATLWLVHDIPPSPTLDDSVRLAAACARTHDGGSGSAGARIPHLRTRHRRAPRIPAHIRTHLPAQACAAKDDTGKDEGEGKRGGVTPSM